MKKFINLIFAVIMTVSAANATSINKTLSNSNINKAAVSISVKDAETGKILYELNSDKPVPPASTLKAVSIAAVINELGKDYNFSTELYKNTNNELILKLGADPFLKSVDLKNLIRTAKEKNITAPKSFFIDDTIIDKTEWGEGWQWDDDLNPLMPKFSSYNLDNNLLKIFVQPTFAGAPAEIKTDIFYPTTFVNLTTTGKTNNIEISRNNNIAPDVLNVTGTVSKRQQIEIPINYPKRYFIIRLEDAISCEDLEYYGNFTNIKLPDRNIYEVAKITNPIEKAVEEIMQKSNNMVAETVFKIAGGHYAEKTGTTKDAVKMLLNYCNKLNVDTENIKIVDGSGVSKNNLVTADFMTAFLIAQYKNDKSYKDSFASAGEGTLKDRMLYFKDNLRAKTGTLCNVSAITGFIQTGKGKLAVFDIMINDPNSNNSDKKMLEDYIIRAIQTSY